MGSVLDNFQKSTEISKFHQNPNEKEIIFVKRGYSGTTPLNPRALWNRPCSSPRLCPPPILSTLPSLTFSSPFPSRLVHLSPPLPSPPLPPVVCPLYLVNCLDSIRFGLLYTMPFSLDSIRLGLLYTMSFPLGHAQSCRMTCSGHWVVAVVWKQIKIWHFTALYLNPWLA